MGKAFIAVLFATVIINVMTSATASSNLRKAQEKVIIQNSCLQYQNHTLLYYPHRDRYCTLRYESHLLIYTFILQS